MPNCEHNKRIDRCEICKPDNFCNIHHKDGLTVQKRNCHICSPKNFCFEHGDTKSKDKCPECSSHRFCFEHGKTQRKSRCNECCKLKGTGEKCEHNVMKQTCKKCEGNQVCEHKKHKAKCVECKGSQICNCNPSNPKRKENCKNCGGSNLCKNSWCETYKNMRNPKYEGYCSFCFINMFPDNTISRNYKTKERAVTDYILKEYPDFTWICDKKVQDGCSNRRPDLMLDLGYQVIIIEVDENQHTAYDCSCENKRLMELSKDINHRNLVFIRFNPDAYKTRTNKTINSCWKINKKSGILIISSQNNWDSRLNAVKETIQYWIDNKTNKTIEVVELFYDEFE